MEIGQTYVVRKTCPVCGETISITKVRSRLFAETTDDDFCVHYKDFNPYYYTVWVCEKCGYAADEKRFLAIMPERNKKKIQAFLKDRKIGIAYTETRTHAEAVASFKLAIFYSDMLNESIAHIAGFYLQLAWLYRESEERDKEDEILRKVIELYDQSLMTERYPLGSLTDTTVIYLIGALYNRLGDTEKTTQYLSRIISDQDSRIVERKVFEKARDLWQDIRNKGANGPKA